MLWRTCVYWNPAWWICQRNCNGRDSLSLEQLTQNTLLNATRLNISCKHLFCSVNYDWDLLRIGYRNYAFPSLVEILAIYVATHWWIKYGYFDTGEKKTVTVSVICNWDFSHQALHAWQIWISKQYTKANTPSLYFTTKICWRYHTTQNTIKYQRFAYFKLYTLDNEMLYMIWLVALPLYIYLTSCFCFNSKVNISQFIPTFLHYVFQQRPSLQIRDKHPYWTCQQCLSTQHPSFNLADQ